MNLLKNLSLIFLSVFISLILFELFLHIDDYHPDYEQFSLLIAENKYLVNDSPADFFKDESPEKTVFLGDSFTVNKVCAHEKKDFVNLIKKKYSTESKSFYNFAIGGTGIAEYAAVLSKISDRVQNIIVVLYYNDIFFDKKSCESISEINNVGFRDVPFCEKVIQTSIDSSNDTKLKVVDNFLETRFYSYQLIKEALVNIPYISNIYSRSKWKDLYQNYDSVENKLFIDLLKFIKKTSLEKNISTNFVYFPDVVYLSVNNNNTRLQAWKNFISYAGEQGININDPWEFFIEHSSKTNLSWSYVDDHPNCEANQIMSKYLSNLFTF